MKDLVKKYYLNEGRNCAETMLLAARDYYNLSIDDDHIKMFKAFGGGIYEEDICGAVSGGVAVLSLMLNDEELKKSVISFKAKVKHQLSSIDCRDIKPLHRDSLSGCNNVVETSFKILTEIIDNIKKAE